MVDSANYVKNLVLRIGIIPNDTRWEENSFRIHLMTKEDDVHIVFDENRDATTKDFLLAKNIDIVFNVDKVRRISAVCEHSVGKELYIGVEYADTKTK